MRFKGAVSNVCSRCTKVGTAVAAPARRRAAAEEKNMAEKVGERREGELVDLGRSKAKQS